MIYHKCHITQILTAVCRRFISTVYNKFILICNINSRSSFYEVWYLQHVGLIDGNLFGEKKKKKVNVHGEVVQKSLKESCCNYNTAHLTTWGSRMLNKPQTCLLWFLTAFGFTLVPRVGFESTISIHTCRVYERSAYKDAAGRIWNARLVEFVWDETFGETYNSKHFIWSAHLELMIGLSYSRLQLNKGRL